MNPRLLLRPSEAADALGLSRAVIYALVRTGEIPSVRVGRAVRIPLDRLQEWVQARTEGTIATPVVCGVR